VFTDMQAWRTQRRALGSASLGFVPTMGALHDGHGALVKASVAGNQHTAVSIYVNPTQFDQPADLAAYPVDTERDLALLEQWGADFVLLPRYADIYPDQYRYRVSEEQLSQKWCGAHRPGHFTGMLTVVLRLLGRVMPTRAYFGEKDYQQLLLVRGMVEAFGLDVQVIGCPVVREADGLAMSSRNRRLSAAQRQQAARLNQVLRTAATASAAQVALEAEGFEVDYVDDHRQDDVKRRLAAVQLGPVRLIDNVPLGATEGDGHAR
jgi:pantoate--beta-alanine ligase